MSRKSLTQRIDDCVAPLDAINNALVRHSTKLPMELSGLLQEFLQCRSDFSHWRSLIDARNASRHLLSGLEARVDVNDRVDVGGHPVEFNSVRLFLTQAYLSSSWSLADHLMAACGRILLAPDASANPKSPPQLLNLLTQDRKKSCPGLLYRSFKKSLGWPIGISYATRNLFLHDGGRAENGNFFLGPTSNEAFQISPAGWNFLVGRAKSYSVEETDTIPLWPNNPHNDLRTILDLCEQEVDCALGIVLGSACGALRSHVTFLVEED